MAEPEEEVETKPAKGGKKGVAKGAKGVKRDWPKSLPERVRAVRTVLAESGGGVGVDAVAGAFKGAQKKVVGELLETLVALGQARRVGEGYAG